MPYPYVSMALKYGILLCFPSKKKKKNIRVKEFLDAQQNDKKFKPVAFLLYSTSHLNEVNLMLAGSAFKGKSSKNHITIY